MDLEIDIDIQNRKLWSMINGIIPKSIAPTIAQLVVSTLVNLLLEQEAQVNGRKRM
jgi:hypothetical protein